MTTHPTPTQIPTHPAHSTPSRRLARSVAKKSPPARPAHSVPSRPSPFPHLSSFPWTARDYRDYCALLASLAEDDYRDFVLRGTPTDRPLLGVRTPVQRQIAAAISRGFNLKSAKISTPHDPDRPKSTTKSPAALPSEPPALTRFLSHAPTSFEEVNIRGFVIAALPYDLMLKLLPAHLPLIDNWGNCDCLCASLKSIKTHQDHFLDHFIRPALQSSPEFQVRTAPAKNPPRTAPAQNPATPSLTLNPEFTTRTALVCLLNYYLTPDYLPVVFDLIPPLFPSEKYYIQMALAWLLATAFAKFPAETFAYLSAVTSQIPKSGNFQGFHSPKTTISGESAPKTTPTLPRPLLQKTLQKIRDSHRIDPEWQARASALADV